MCNSDSVAQEFLRRCPAPTGVDVNVLRIPDCKEICAFVGWKRINLHASKHEHQSEEYEREMARCAPLAVQWIRANCASLEALTLKRMPLHLLEPVYALLSLRHFGAFVEEKDNEAEQFLQIVRGQARTLRTLQIVSSSVEPDRILAGLSCAKLEKLQFCSSSRELIEKWRYAVRLVRPEIAFAGLPVPFL
jgi:hypothetical protein